MDYEINQVDYRSQQNDYGKTAATALVVHALRIGAAEDKDKDSQNRCRG
jgi:hypothetical protein